MAIKRKRIVDPDAYFVCIESFGTNTDGEPIACSRGTRLRGDHPYVQRWPQFFLPDSTPDDELAAARREHYRQAGAPAPLT